ncbi:hypothetical protein QOZ95_000646 [Paenibacillus brasilensis]|uniref:Uncharacterized protein n=1 Tax=Paenibacillus brasilensis TaxID=128574 RepID=A0ABU0KSU4_9BACL|nr:hypothetical protein [Paenibacillus brasilensis]
MTSFFHRDLSNSQSQTLNEKAFKTTVKMGLKASLLLEILSKVGLKNHKMTFGTAPFSFLETFVLWFFIL